LHQAEHRSDLSGRRVVVVGGGVVGCAVGYFLARAGLGVTLVERDAIAAHASGRNAGNLNPLHRTPKQDLALALEALTLHREIAVELTEIGCGGYVLTPTLRVHLGCGEADRAELVATAALFSATAGFSASWLNRAELLAIDQRLAPAVAFGVVTTGNLTVDAGDLTRSLAAAMRRLNGQVIKGTVSGIMAASGRVTGVRIGDHVLPCDEVVFATGPWVADVEAWLGVNLGIEPVKGEMLLVRLPGGAPTHDFHLAEAALYRRGHDEVWIGGTTERRGFDVAPSDQARRDLLQGAARIMPQVIDAEVLDHVAALRPMAGSGSPITARASGWANAYFANGGGAKGVLFSVTIARTVRDMLISPLGGDEVPPAEAKALGAPLLS
jgi:glycine/D-amino acid oxidase-like deaminating enzyme